MYGLAKWVLWQQPADNRDLNKSELMSEFLSTCNIRNEAIGLPHCCCWAQSSPCIVAPSLAIIIS